VERRGGAKENAELQSTVRTQSRKAVSQAQARIREAVNRNRQDKLTALLHHLGQHIRGGGVAVEPAGIILGDPDLDQVTADAVALGEGVGRLSANCRLNSIECVRCSAMGFLLESPVQLADSQVPHLSTPRGALHPRCKRNLTFPRSVRVQPCIRPVFEWRTGSITMQPLWPLALM
jgi:hypothetical protein